MIRCNKPTKHGPCQIPLRGGKCMTHDSDLSKRNRAVAQSFKTKRPTAFYAQRVYAGKRGWQVTLTRHGLDVVTRATAHWRIEHPSEPERWIKQLLDRHGYTHYDREHGVGLGRTVDFAFVEERIAIEVNGHHSKPSVGETEPRTSKQSQKLRDLQKEGWTVYVVNALADRSDEQRRLLEFLQGHLASNIAPSGNESTEA